MPSEKADILVRTDSLQISFGRNVVLRDISLDIPRGQTLAIIGERTSSLSSGAAAVAATSHEGLRRDASGLCMKAVAKSINAQAAPSHVAI